VGDLLTNEKDMLCCLIEIIANRYNHKYEAKEIMIEHKITETDFL